MEPKANLDDDPMAAKSVRSPQVDQFEEAWIKTDCADVTFGILVSLSAIVLGLEVENDINGQEGFDLVLFILQITFCCLFVFELALRVAADGRHFLTTPVGVFDAVVVALSVIELVTAVILGGETVSAFSAVRVFRLLRVLRVLRLVRLCDGLSVLVASFLSSSKALLWVSCLSFLLVYTSALVCTMELGYEVRQYFGSIGGSIFTHAKIITLEGFPSVVRAMGEVSAFWYIYTVLFITFSNVVFVNLVTGIIVENVSTTTRAEKMERTDQECSLYLFVKSVPSPWVASLLAWERPCVDFIHTSSSSWLFPVFCASPFLHSARRLGTMCELALNNLGLCIATIVWIPEGKEERHCFRRTCRRERRE